MLAALPELPSIGGLQYSFRAAAGRRLLAYQARNNEAQAGRHYCLTC